MTAIVIIQHSKLGKCWDSRAQIGACFKCERYDRCIFPESVASKEYDDLRKKASRLKHESDLLFDQLRNMKS